MSSAQHELTTYEKERGKPMPSDNHASIQANLAGLWFNHPDFRTKSEVTLDLGEKPDLTPDLSVFPRKPLDLRHDQIRVSEPPIQVVEILSPTQGSFELMQRMDRYFAHGVKSCWIVIPTSAAVTVYLPGGTEQTVSEGLVRDPVTGLEADLGLLFS